MTHLHRSLFHFLIFFIPSPSFKNSENSRSKQQKAKPLTIIDGHVSQQCLSLCCLSRIFFFASVLMRELKVSFGRSAKVIVRLRSKCSPFPSLVLLNFIFKAFGKKLYDRPVWRLFHWLLQWNFTGQRTWIPFFLRKTRS